METRKVYKKNLIRKVYKKIIIMMFMDKIQIFLKMPMIQKWRSKLKVYLKFKIIMILSNNLKKA
jgi:hypothetical protein